MTVTFCGHAEVHDEEAVRTWLTEQVEACIRQGADVFYLGGYGGFDRMAAGVVGHLKKAHPQIQSILVLPYLDRKVDASGYDGTTYPPLENVPKRYAILRRNRWMVDNADIVIAYVRHDWGGAAATAQYAARRGKTLYSWNGE